MKTVIVGDRIRNRAKTCEVYAFDEIPPFEQWETEGGR